MRKITVLLISAVMAFTLNVWGQSTTIDFETDGDGYTSSGTHGSDFTDVFNRTNPNIGGNATYMWSVESINLTNPSITLDQIDLTGATDFTFSLDMIAHHYNDWDNGDELLITYSIDGGAYQNLMWVQSITDPGSAYNEPAALDTDFDGTGECAYVLPALSTGTGALGCLVSSSIFETFSTSAIALSSNSTLDIILQFNGLTSADEGIYLDNININLSGGSTTPLISVVPSSLSGFGYVFGSGSSPSQSFDVSGSDLTADIDITPPTNYEISDDDITFQSTAIVLAQSGGSVTSTTLYTRLKVGLAGGNYNEDITCTSTDATDKTVNCDGTVEAPATTTLPYSETFDADLGDCYTYSVSGATKEWVWSSSYAYMSGYNSGDTEEDWLVLPGIDFDSYSNELMTFETYYNHGTDDVNNYLKLYYSTDYPGIGDPTDGYTWAELTFTYPSATQTWTSSGVIDLSGITGTSVYIAFKYNYEDGSYRNWEVDNISIYEQIEWANLQWPETGTITVGGNFDVYARVFKSGVTEPAGQGAGITTWIGYSNTDTDPSTWTDWVLATYNGDDANNDEYVADIGADITLSGTYYYASRFQYGASPFIYGGFSGGFWDGSSNVSGVLTVNPSTTQIDWANLQWPQNGTVTMGGDFNIFAQVYEPGVTNSGGQGTGITAWIGYSTTNTDPSTWTDWVAASYNGDSGDNDEYMANLGAAIISTGTFYYASRFKLDLADYVYGGFNGGFWDGTTNVSGVLTVEKPNVMINEVDADQTSTDTQEFIELYDGGDGNTDLSGLVVVRFNGSDDQSYDAAFDLDGQSTDVNGYFVLGSGTVPNVDMVIGATNLIQNGTDAVALFVANGTDFPNDTPIPGDLSNLVDALVYDTGDGDDAALLVLLNAGQPQINEQGRGDGEGHSNQRIPNGTGGFRNTYTYDQSPPTPGAANVGLYTDWTGAVDSDWNTAGNWSNVVPTAALNTSIPDVSAKAPFPILSGPAICLSLNMASNSILWIDPDGEMTVIGAFTNTGGDLTIKSDATGTGSLIEGTYSGSDINIERYLTADKFQSFSPSVDGEKAGMFHLDGSTGLDVYLYTSNEETFDYNYIYDLDYNLSSFKGFMTYVDGANATPPVSDWTFTETGAINTGSFGYAENVVRTGAPGAGDDEYGWNFFGNPYSSAIDWDAISGWTKTDIDATVYIYNGTGWATYNTNTGGNNGGTQYIATGQGFFVHATDQGGPYPNYGEFALNNDVRLHNSVGYLKSTISNKVSLLVEGNNYSDETVIIFNEQATVGFDSEYDAYKLDSQQTGVPALYSVGNTKLAVNVLPQVEWVQLGFKSDVSGTFTISAIEINDIGIVLLEDTFTGEMTDLSSNSYTFVYNESDDANRFIVHFTPLAIGDNIGGVTNIYSHNKSIYVNVPDNTQGEIFIYNMMGQNVVSTQINGSLNKISLNESAYYLVKVVSNEQITSTKVFIK